MQHALMHARGHHLSRSASASSSCGSACLSIIKALSRESKGRSRSREGVRGGVRERRRLTEEAKGGPWVALNEIQTCSAARCGASPHMPSSESTTYDNTARGHRFYPRTQTDRPAGRFRNGCLPPVIPGLGPEKGT